MANPAPTKGEHSDAKSRRADPGACGAVPRTRCARAPPRERLRDAPLTDPGGARSPRACRSELQGVRARVALVGVRDPLTAGTPTASVRLRRKIALAIGPFTEACTALVH